MVVVEQSAKSFHDHSQTTIAQNMKTGLTAFALLSLLTSVAAQDLEAFPAAKEGMERFVVELPHTERSEEVNFKVELIVGNEIMTDGVNSYRYIGVTIESKELEGWGCSYYELAKLGRLYQTMKGASGATPVKEFVSCPSLQIPYNSRVPVVVYVPKGAELRYRIWKASDRMEKAKKA